MPPTLRSNNTADDAVTFDYVDYSTVSDNFVTNGGTGASAYVSVQQTTNLTLIGNEVDAGYISMGSSSGNNVQNSVISYNHVGNAGNNPHLSMDMVSNSVVELNSADYFDFDGSYQVTVRNNTALTAGIQFGAHLACYNLASYWCRYLQPAAQPWLTRGSSASTDYMQNDLISDNVANGFELAVIANSVFQGNVIVDPAITTAGSGANVEVSDYLVDDIFVADNQADYSACPGARVSCNP